MIQTERGLLFGKDLVLFLAHIPAEMLEGSPQTSRGPFPGGQIAVRHGLQVLPQNRCSSRIFVNGDLADLFNNVLIDPEGDVGQRYNSRENVRP